MYKIEDINKKLQSPQMRCPAVFLVKDIVLNSTRCDHYDPLRSLFFIVFPATLNVMQSVSRTWSCHAPAVRLVSISVYFALTVFTAEYAP